MDRIPGLDKVVSITKEILKEGEKQRTGTDEQEGYKFGDFTRGLVRITTSRPASQSYGVWDGEGEGEFGQILRPNGVDSPLDHLPDGSATVLELLDQRKAATSNAVGTRSLIEVHRVNEGGKTFEKLELANKFDWLTYAEYIMRVKKLAQGLQNRTKISAGSRLVIYAETQRDWMVTAFAAFALEAEVVTIYATLGADGARFGINQTQAAVCVVDTKLLKVITQIVAQCACLKHVVTLATCTDNAELEKAGVQVGSIEELVAGEGDIDFPKLKPQNTAIVMYTSGTTGVPKGVLVSHSNLVAACAGFGQAATKIGITSADAFLAYLPLAHIMEMVAEIACLQLGCSMGYGSPHTLIDSSVKLKTPETHGDAVVLKPTFMVFAPAVFDKVYKAVISSVDKQEGLIKRAFNFALERGERLYEDGGVGVDPVLNLVFRKVQASLGGSIRFAITGSAPLSPEIQRFMQTVLKAPVRQGYGLTENCACATLGDKDDNAVNNAGAPTACTVIRLADWPEGGYLNSHKDKNGNPLPQGEVLVGGPSVCMGYLVDEKNPDPEIVMKNKTDFVTIAGVRYFRTGDVGQIHPNGTLQIIDRKKDLWKGSNGEYVSLSKVESALKLSPCVDIPMVYGKTGGEFPVALVCPVPSELNKFAEQEGLTGKPIEELCKTSSIMEAVLKSCRDACKQANLVEFEIPRKIALLSPVDGTPAWTPENDMLTAAMKLKRPNIIKLYAADLDALHK